MSPIQAHQLRSRSWLLPLAMALVSDPTYEAQGMPPVNQADSSIAPWFDVEALATPPHTPPQYSASLRPESRASSCFGSPLRRSHAMRYPNKPFGPRSQGSQRHARPTPRTPGTGLISPPVSPPANRPGKMEFEQVQVRETGGSNVSPGQSSRPRTFALFDEPNRNERKAHRLSSLHSLSSPHSPEPSGQIPTHSSLMESLAKAPMLPLLIDTGRRSQRSRSGPHHANDSVTSPTADNLFGLSATLQLVESPLDIHAPVAPHSQSSSMFLLPSVDYERRDSSLEIDITEGMMELLSGFDVTQQLSTTHHQVTAAPCLVCFDAPSQFPDLPPTSECTHASTICTSCLQKHISHAVQSQGSTTLTCPDPECRQAMEYQDVVRGAKGDQACLDRYEALLLRRTLENDPNYVWCKNPACGWGQIHDGGDITPIVTCQACSALSCFTHDMPWHVGLSCEQYAETIRKGEEASQAYIDKHAKICPNPNCGRRIEKAEGCDHMTCRRPAGCGHEFCWICLADYEPIRREGNHRHNLSCIHYAPPRSSPFQAHLLPHTFHGLEAVPEEPAAQPVFPPVVEHQHRFNPFGSALPAFLQRYHPPRFNRRLVDRAQV